MSQQSAPSATSDNPSGDPWHALGYIVAGVAVYGVLGWLADRWLGTTFLVAIGILVGAGLGIFMTYARFNRAPAEPGPADSAPAGPEPDTNDANTDDQD